MIRLAIVVEGETEERFVKEALTGHLFRFDVAPVPIIAGRSINAERLAAEMSNLRRNFDRVTSLVDFYGFRGKGTDTPDLLERRVSDAIQARIGRPPDSSLIFPYVQLHEFESLLFTDVGAFTSVPGSTNQLIDRLRAIRSNFATPEDINDNYATAPSRRITSEFPGYSKVVHGPEIIADIGLETIREECPRFNGWLSRLESLGRGTT